MKQCEQCGKSFEGNAKKRFCSNACRSKNNRDKEKSILPATFVCDDCGKVSNVQDMFYVVKNVRGGVKSFGPGRGTMGSVRLCRSCHRKHVYRPISNDLQKMQDKILGIVRK